MEFVFSLSPLGRYKEGWRYYEARFTVGFRGCNPADIWDGAPNLNEAPRAGQDTLLFGVSKGWRCYSVL